MAQIQVNHLTFYYEGSYEEIFKDVSFSLDTNWKLGFIGRNGRGKTTFLNLLMGKYEYQGTILSPELFDYFPFSIPDPRSNTIDLIEKADPQYELWKVMREMNLLEVEADVLYRPFDTLSNGEQTKVMLAVLFSKEHRFLLIDEPTNHLDMAARRLIGQYLNEKSGFILVSHDRAFLDSCIDHVLSLNKNTIEVVKGNFSSWQENKSRKDTFELQENEKLRKDINRLQVAARQAEGWSDKVEKTKYGTRVAGLRPDRGAIGHKAAKMVKRAKSAENRLERAVLDKEKLLKDVETAEDLKIISLHHHKEALLSFQHVSLSYGEKTVCKDLSFQLRQGETVFLSGKNGCGKSTAIKAILKQAEWNGNEKENGVLHEDLKQEPLSLRELSITGGKIESASGLTISYVSQDTSWLWGNLSDFMVKYGLDATLFLAVLRKFDFSRDHFQKEMQYYSEGQKKKVLLAKSLCERAHLYIWDEPLNFIDVFSRMQIEDLIKKYRLTMILVEHDQRFIEELQARKILLQKN